MVMIGVCSRVLSTIRTSVPASTSAANRVQRSSRSSQ